METNILLSCNEETQGSLFMDNFLIPVSNMGEMYGSLYS